MRRLITCMVMMCFCLAAEAQAIFDLTASQVRIDSHQYERGGCPSLSGDQWSATAHAADCDAACQCGAKARTA